MKKSIWVRVVTGLLFVVAIVSYFFVVVFRVKKSDDITEPKRDIIKLYSNDTLVFAHVVSKYSTIWSMNLLQ